MFTSIPVTVADAGEGVADAEADLGRDGDEVETVKPVVQCECPWLLAPYPVPIMPFLVNLWSPSTAPPAETSAELFARDTREGVFITTGDLGMPGEVGGLARGAELIECAPRLWWNRLVVTFVTESVLRPFTF